MCRKSKRVETVLQVVFKHIFDCAVHMLVLHISLIYAYTMCSNIIHVIAQIQFWVQTVMDTCASSFTVIFLWGLHRSSTLSALCMGVHTVYKVMLLFSSFALYIGWLSRSCWCATIVSFSFYRLQVFRRTASQVGQLDLSLLYSSSHTHVIWGTSLIHYGSCWRCCS